MGFANLAFAIFPNVSFPLDVISHKLNRLIFLAALLLFDNKKGNDC
jgi:hypothetical protein